MKIKLVMFFSLSILLSGCSKENKAKEAIKRSLFYTMINYGSYEPIEFGPLDSNVNEEISNNIIASTHISAYTNNFKKTRPMAKYIAYKMNHKFKASNEVGALVINDYTFFFDKDLKHVITYRDNIKERKKGL